MKTSSKSLACIFWLLLITSPVISQVSGGITGGVSINSVELKSTQSNLNGTSNIPGLEAGIFLKVPIGPLYLRPMAVASYAAGTVSYSNEEIEKVETDFSLSTIDVPVLIGINILPVLAIEAGPSWNYLLNYENELNGVDVSFDRHSLGYRAGGRLHYSSLGIFAHYGGIVNKNQGNQFDLSRPSRIIAGITLEFGK